VAQARLANPLSVRSPDYINRFLDYLLAGGTSNRPERSSSGTEQILRNDLSRFSLLDEVDESHIWRDDVLIYIGRQNRISAVYREILEIARNDLLDVRELTAFIDEWICFIRNWGDPIPHVRGFLHPRYMMFWAALRRGWANWRPSQRCRDQTRDVLLRETQIQHRFYTAPDRPSYYIARERYQRLNNQGHLPGDERIRLDPLYYPTDICPDRMFTRWRNWNAMASLVEENRLPDEANFSIRLLRMDRLERLIREERLLNDGQMTDDTATDDTATDDSATDIANDNIAWEELAYGVVLDDSVADDEEEEDEEDEEDEVDVEMGEQ
jgi:hypothetical protein